MTDTPAQLDLRLSRLAVRFSRSAAVAAVLLLAVVLGGILPAATLRAEEELPKVIVVATGNTADTAGGIGEGVFTLSLSKALKSNVKVHFTVKGTAISGTDYVAIADTKVIKAGKTSVNIDVVPKGDDGRQDRTVTLSLKKGAGYTLGNRKNATVEIVYTIELP